VRSASVAFARRDPGRGLDGCGPTIVGYAAVFNEEAVIADFGDRYRERVVPGAFDAALASRDVVLCLDHRPTVALGCRSAGTLFLRVDAVGLFFAWYLMGDAPRNAVMGPLRAGRIQGVSIGFDGGEAVWSSSERFPSCPLRTLRRVDLTEISLVEHPAYRRTKDRLEVLDGLLGPRPWRSRRVADTPHAAVTAVRGGEEY